MGPSREEQGMTRTLREKDPDRDTGPNCPPAKKDKNGIKGAKNGCGPFGLVAPSPWLKSIADYERHQPREFQVTRFG
jgi:hypothetical protein